MPLLRFRPCITLCLLPFACAKVSSSDLRTQGMSADLNVTASSNGSVETSATLRQGEVTSLQFIELTGSDRLYATVGQLERQLTKTELLNVVSYRASFNGENSENNEFSFKFVRSVDNGAPRSACQLPKAFEITQPVSMPTFKRSMDDIVVAYEPANTTDRLRYKLSGSCIKEKEYPYDGGDGGRFSIPRSQFEPFSNEAKTQACDVTITVSRYRLGGVDAAFGKGGKIECVQSRAVTVRSEP